MKERAFVADAREAKGLHDGSITKIMRVIDPQPEAPKRHPWVRSQFAGVDDKGDGVWCLEAASVPRNQFGGTNIHTSQCLVCPFGIVGDRLVVRETCAISPEIVRDKGHRYVTYKATPSTEKRAVLAPHRDSDEWIEADAIPYWASRTLLDVTDVRVVWIQDVTEEEIERLGIKSIEQDTGASTPWGEWITTADFHTPFMEMYSDIWNNNKWIWLGTVRKV